MKTKQQLARTCIALATITAVSTGAQAALMIGGQAYNPTGSSESLSASFLTADGGVSTNTYRGLVLLTVSGWGQSLGAELNDAFYIYNASSHFVPGGAYELVIDDVALVGPNAAQNAKHFIVYDVDAGTEVTTRPHVPAYRETDHAYSFVLDMALLGVVGSSQLHFGVMDDKFFDNSGAYNIRITQLTVPEPGTSSLAAFGVLGLLAAARRRRTL